MNKKNTTSEISVVFCKNIYKLCGFPKIIVSGNYTKFRDNLWKDFCKTLGTSINMSSTYHPQIDGWVKLLITYWNPTLIVHDKQRKWFQRFHLTKWWNT